MTSTWKAAFLAGVTFLSATFIVGSLNACNKSDENKDTKDSSTSDDKGGTGSSKTSDTETGATLSTSLVVVGTVNVATELTSASPGRSFSLSGSPNNFYNVMAPASKLESLKLFIGSIEICKEVTLNGTAISGTAGCITLYDGPDDGTITNTSDLSAAYARAASVNEGYIDLMDAESRKKVDQKVVITEDQIGEYSYGKISWATPIKVKATLLDPADGTTEKLYTKAGSPGKCQVNNNPEYDCMIASSSLTTGPAEEAVIGGGSNIIFKFQNPLVITAEDIKEQTAFSLKLAFNPDGLLQGVTPNGATNFPSYTDASLGNGYNLGNTIALVGAQVAPIFHKSSTEVLRESYSATVPASGGNGTFKLRVEFYTLANDPNRTIYGASIATLPTADYSGYLVGYRSVYGIKTNTDGSIDLLNYDQSSIISSFNRKPTVGETTTADLDCDTTTLNCTAGQALSATFTLDAAEPL